MTDEDHILEQIDACRPKSDDLRDPHNSALARRLAEDPQAQALYNRVQKLDTRIAAAFDLVEVPDGLADRLLREVSRSELSHGQTPDDIVATVEDPLVAATPPPGRRIGRREAVVAGLALAASILLAVFVGQRTTDELSSEELFSLVDDFYIGQHPNQQHPNQPANRLDQKLPPEAYPFSPSVNCPKSTLWRPLSGFLGRAGTVFTFTTPGGAEATLYVVKLEGPRSAVRLPSQLPGTVPKAPRFTAGRSTAAWQSGGRLYVLVVEGNERDYQKALKRADLA